jgi:hypothetical protein
MAVYIFNKVGITQYIVVSQSEFHLIQPKGEQNEWKSHILTLCKSSLIVDLFDWKSGEEGKAW